MECWGKFWMRYCDWWKKEEIYGLICKGGVCVYVLVVYVMKWNMKVWYIYIVVLSVIDV